MTQAKPTQAAMPGAFSLGQPSRPPVEGMVYRDAMASMGATVCLVTAQRGAERLGRTVTSAFSLSVEPPAILVSIDIAGELADLIATTRGFSFAMLAETQPEIADAFAGHVDPERRFDGGRWLQWKSGHPKLAGAVVTMDCEVIGTMTTDTHLLFAGAVVDVETNAGLAPLIWHRRRYRTLSGAATPPDAVPAGRDG